jgi:4-hydroxy-tetrahydrodipicolinate reductase
MKLLILGRGKTGSLVADVARQREHIVRVLGSSDNPRGVALTPAALQEVELIIDFTTPTAALENLPVCIRAGKNVVVGTTGWYSEMPGIRKLVAENKTGFLYGSNFSIGVNIFFDIIRSAAAALKHGYNGQIFERHHAQKKDAPSGTAITIQKTIAAAAGSELEIISFREGDVVGMHELVLDSPNDDIYLCHDAKSRRSFAEGAVRAAEWLAGKHGFFDFKDIWREL